MTHLSFSIHYGSPSEIATETHRPFVTNAEAKSARDAKYWELKKNGFNICRAINKNQLRQYWSYGRPCGIIADCYEIYIKDGE